MSDQYHYDKDGKLIGTSSSDSPLVKALKGLAGVAVAVFILLVFFANTNPKGKPSSSAPIGESHANRQGAPSGDAPSHGGWGAIKPISPPSTTPSLVGTWRADVSEDGSDLTIFYHVRPDGTTRYEFVSRDHKSESTGTWRYADGILSETFSNGGQGKGSVAWIDYNHFELTIIDNGHPDWRGIKRNYYRQWGNRD